MGWIVLDMGVVVKDVKPKDAVYLLQVGVDQHLKIRNRLATYPHVSQQARMRAIIGRSKLSHDESV